ncbi:MAG: AMP-binding protein [Proteobacteria bacterium]|nr:AMP-binding protein [Pseudomonadota bacterium]
MNEGQAGGATDRVTLSAPGASIDPAFDTFPKLLKRHAAVRGSRPAMREKNYGIWQSSTWAQVAVEVRALACGLASLGLRRGESVAIVGDNRPRLYWTMAAVQALGGIPVPMYQDAVADEMKFVLDHASARFAVVENQEQVDKLLQVWDECPALEKIIYDDERGMRNYAQALLHNMDDVIAAGRRFDGENPGFFDDEVAKGKGSDTAIILYTSGTTGRPKGVVLTHEAIYLTSINAARQEGLNENDECLAYLPMAWVGDHVLSYAQSYAVGFCVSCPESSDTLLIDLRELGPTYFFAPPRIFENILTSVMIRIADASAIKRKMFEYFMAVARRSGSDILDHRPVGLRDRILYALGDLLVYGPLKNTLGLSRVRVGYTAGEAIGPEIFVFYRSLGINLKQLYGSTEACVFITVQPDGEVKSDTVGVPTPGVEIKLAENGEVMFRSPGVFKEYFKNPEATAETKTADGWVHTGDAGLIDEDGHLKIIDRAKDVGRFADGTLFAPKYIENKLKFFSHIKEVVALGDQRDFCAVIVNIDLEAVGNWAERRGIAYSSYQELAALPSVYDLVQKDIEQVNSDLAQDATLVGAQIRRFLVLHKELDADDGELTRTRKVRRNFIAEKYATVIEALYGTADHCQITTELTFEDGRKGTISADLSIRDVQTVSAGAQLAAE